MRVEAATHRDGTALVPYTGPPLTIGGELNKLAHNMSAGRDMSGVHWRVSDDLTGLFRRGGRYPTTDRGKGNLPQSRRDCLT